MIKSKKITYKGYELKSNLEYFFFIYLEELQEAGFIQKFSYEEFTYELSGPINVEYIKQMKTKIKDSEEFLMHKCTYTPDFEIEWAKQAENVFYLNGNKAISSNLKEIPFRLINQYGKLISHIEVKPSNESKLDSSKEFPTLRKWIFQKFENNVQKIVPYDSYGKNCLMQQTFVPSKIVKSEIYKKQGKWGNVGDSKIKFSIRTIEQYLKLRGYER